MLAGVSLAAKLDDLVTSLPDQPALQQKWYSGLINSTEHKQFHYVFVESKRDPANDPVIVWLDGGPGVASMNGLFGGIGPLL